jgi:hypothetical protein
VPTQKVTYFPLDGGLDIVSPDLVVKPGRLRFSSNYEPRSTGGYRRIDGYERYDGNPKPSLANQAFFDVIGFTNTVAVGDRLVGSVNGYVAFVIDQFDGIGLAYDFADIDQVFVDTEVLTNSTQANTYATVDLSTDAIVGPFTTDGDSINGNIGPAQTLRRGNISEVPGEGVVRGIHRLEDSNGDLYAFRNNVGSTAQDLYKDSPAGWILQDLGQSITYTVGAIAKFLMGESISDGGGATGIVTAVNITSGTFLGGNAVGTVYFHTLTGTFAAGTITGADSGGTATIVGASTSITLNAGGKHDIVSYNFFGQLTSLAMYGAYGTGDAYMWNGSGMALLPEASDDPTSFPSHIYAHKFHLFLSFKSSMINSNIGDPFSYTALGGASEIAVGDDITGFDAPQGDVLAVFSKDSTNLLYGTSSANWELRNHSRVSGAKEWTIQRVGNTRYLDDRGLTQLAAVDAFGDFHENSFSKYIDPLVKAKMGKELDSIIVREKDQYRIFYNDGTALIARVLEQGGFPHFTPIEYPLNVNNCITTERTDGVEELFFASDDPDNGFVYQMDSGNSFDGEALEYYARLPYNTIGSPRHIKRFFKIVLEVETEIGVTSTVDVKYAPDFSYGNPDRPKGIQQEFEVSGGGAYWNEGIEWADFFWGQLPNEAEGYIKGSGRNIGLSISGSSILDGSHTITGMTIQYALRGVKK